MSSCPPEGKEPISEARAPAEPSGRGQFIRFCLVGAVGFVVDVTVLYAAAGLLGWYAARVLSFMAAVTATWWFNRRFTFAATARDKENSGGGNAMSILGEYCKYVGSMLGGAAVNYAAYVLALRLLHGPWAGAAGVAAGSIAGLAVNFCAARFFVFRR